MSRPKKRRSSQPARLTGPMPPVEIIELTGHSKRAPAPPVTLTPADQVEILEAPSIPRKQLVVVLRLAPGSDPAAVALAAARFVSDVQAADRKLRLAVDPAQSRAAGGDVTLVLTPASAGVETAGRLEKLIDAVRTAAAAFAGATLGKVEVVPRV